MDAIAMFDQVLVPWERVFLLGDVELANHMGQATNQYLHSGHQVVTKNVAKAEFMVGLASLMVTTLGSTGTWRIGAGTYIGATPAHGPFQLGPTYHPPPSKAQY